MRWTVLGSVVGCMNTQEPGGVRMALFARRAADAMSRAIGARRERPSRGPGFRSSRPAGPAAPLPASLARRFGLPAGLLAGLLLACATLFPAQAQADPIWSTTMTVGEGTGGNRGYTGNFGSLGEDEFSYESGGITKTSSVERLQFKPTSDTVFFQFYVTLDTFSEYADYTLEVAGEEFPLASRSGGFDDSSHYFSKAWVASNADSLSNANFRTTLAVGGEVQVCLRLNTDTDACAGETPSDDATLSSLSVVDGVGTAVSLSPTFASDTDTYTANVGNTVSQLNFTAATTDDGAEVTSVTLNGTAISDTDLSDLIYVPSLIVGDNVIVLTVTAEDSSTEDYTVTVTRAAYVCTAPDLTDRTEVWTGTLTVGNSGTTYGYSSATGDSYGGLTDTTIDIGTDSYTIEGIRQFILGAHEYLTLDLDSSFPESDRDVLRLHVCDGTINLSEATHSSSDHSYSTNTFSRSGDWPDAFHWSSGATTVRLALSTPRTNTAATGMPLIEGAPQVGQTLTAGAGDMADADNLPTTAFPTGYSFQWVLGGTDISGETSQTYDPVAADIGNTLQVKVTFTDGGGTAETLTSTATAAVVAAAEGCAARTDADWCSTMTVGAITGGTAYSEVASPDIGSLDDDTINYGDEDFWVRMIAHIDDDVHARIDVFVPRGTVFDFGGTEFPANATSEQTGTGFYKWDRPSDFGWIDGQKVTVSANLPPRLVTATVNGTELVLTYHEDLDTSSVPAATAYTVNGTTATVSSVAVADDKVTLTLSAALTSTDTVTLDYTPGTSPVQDESGIDALSLTNQTVTNNTAVANTDATGQPTITGTPQVGKTLTAVTSDIMDANGLPSTFDYQWVRVDTGDNETDVGSNSSTYTVTAADVGSRIKVEVSFTDNDNFDEEVVSDLVGPAVAALGTCPANSNWSAVLTVGHRVTTDAFIRNALGFHSGQGYGVLNPNTIPHGSMTITVARIIRFLTTSLDGLTVSGDNLTIYISGGELPHGTVLNFGGTALTVSASSNSTTGELDTTEESWNVQTLGLTWVEGQEMRVCANLPPALVTATVDGTSLVLTYSEDLDTSSVPAATAYTVNGTTATVSSVAVADNKVTLTLSAALTSTDTVTLDYDPPGTNPVQDESGIDAPLLDGHTVTNTTGATNTAATGMPSVTGTPQVGQTLTAGAGNMADADNLPTSTFPAGYTFQWLRNETDISGATAQTYDPVAADIGNTLKVKVSFTDGGSTVETLASDPVGPVVRAAEGCAARTDADWCTTMTVRSNPSATGTTYGYRDQNYGSLGNPTTFDDGATNYQVTGIWIWDANDGSDAISIQFENGRVPRGRVFNFGGETFTTDAGSEHSDGTRYRWDRSASLAVWLDGQEVTVSANLPPVVVDATVDGTELVLTYGEDLDTNSTPAVSRYTVKIGGSPGPAVSGVSVSRRKVTLTLATAIAASQTNVTVDYAVPSSNPLQDESGLDAPGFTNRTVTNNTGSNDTTAPSLESGEVQADGNSLHLVFDEDLDLDQTPPLPPADAFTVTVGGTEVTVSALTAAGSDILVLSLSATVKQGQTVRVSYEQPTTDRIQDVSGNETGDFTDELVTNSSTVVDSDGVFENGDVQLMGPSGRIDNDASGNAVSGRLEVFHKGAFGTVCNDRFTSKFRVYGDDHPNYNGDNKVANQAANHACKLLGYAEGEVVLAKDGERIRTVSGDPIASFPEMTVLPGNGNAGDPNGRIWLDDLRCAEFPRGYKTGDPPLAGLLPLDQHCWHAGVGAENCKHKEDVHLQCSGIYEPPQMSDLQQALDPLTAEFVDMPGIHDGETAFAFQVAFSADIENDADDIRDNAFEVTGGAVTDAAKVDDRDDLWEITITPEGDANVTIALKTGLECGTPGAVCTANGAPLETALAVIVQAVGPLTAEFVQVPDEHDGEESFRFELKFSEAIKLPGGRVRTKFTVTNGRMTRVSRIDNKHRERDGLQPNQRWNIWIEPDSDTADVTIVLPATADCAASGAICTEDGRKLSHTVEAFVPRHANLTAEFTGVPATHDGETAFRFEVDFNADIANTAADLRSAFEVRGGGVTDAARVDGRDDLWEIEITPEGDANVTIALKIGLACGTPGAVCTGDGRALGTTPLTSVGANVPEEPEEELPELTAEFRDMPAEHDGENDIVFKLVFSEEVYTGDEQGVDKNRSVREALEITGGTARASSRFVKTSFDAYEIMVTPAGPGTVTITLHPADSCHSWSPTCTPDGRQLSERVEAEVIGPPTLTVADARVEEGENAVLAFAVALSRAASVDVTVDYATSDVSAAAGEDYTETSGTLTFAPGETSHTVEVPVLDDEHDEGNETLKLILSNASGAYIADAEATGTIENIDHMPQAWLARFGRTVAEQVLDAVEARIRSAPAAGVQVTVAGQAIGGAAPDAEALEEAEAKARLEGLSAWLAGETEAREQRSVSRSVVPVELLTGSSFALTTQADGIGGGLVSLWGRGAVSRFDGREGELTLDGEVTGAMLGADWTRERSTLGLMLNHARGEGGYRGADSGEVTSTLTGFYPYGRYMLSDRVTVWGVAGYGAGTLTLTPENDDGTPRAAIRTDMDLAMAAAGLRGVVVAAPPEGGPEVAVKTDALGVRTSSEAVRGSADAGGNLAAAQGDVTRLRLGLEGTWRGLVLGTGTLEPRLEVGVRHDGGDAETGFGLDLGGGLAWSDPGTGIEAGVSGRGLLTHEADGFRERGIAGSFGWDPAPGSDRGPSLTLTQTMGVSARGGVDALLGRRTLTGLAADDDGDELGRRRLEVRFGYGFAAFGDRFTSRPEAGFGMSEGQRDYGLVWRLVRDRRRGDIGSLEFALEARRRESANDNAEPEHDIGFRMTARF